MQRAIEMAKRMRTRRDETRWEGGASGSGMSLSLMLGMCLEEILDMLRWWLWRSEEEWWMASGVSVGVRAV